MISVVIATLNHESVLARALGPLVPAAVSGLVSEVLICDGGSTDATLAIADDAGAGVLQSAGGMKDRLREGCEAARGAWVLLLDPNAWLEPAWQEAARRHIESEPGRAAWFPHASAGPLGRWLARPTAEAFMAPRGLAQAALANPGRLRPRRLEARVFLAENSR